MSIECSECERDARGGHDPDCSRSAESEVKRLRAALKRYGKHAMSCVMRPGDGCICGLDDMLGEKTLPDEDWDDLQP